MTRAPQKTQRKLVYGRPKLIELPEPKLERDLESADKTQFRVMYGTRGVSIRLLPDRLLISLRDLYKNHHKSLRNQITWRELSEISKCEDAINKG